MQSITIKHLFISSGHNYVGRHGKGALNHVAEERSEIELVAGKGVREDRYFDHKEDFKGQITFFDWAIYEKVRDEVVKGDFHPSAFRRNVVVQGVDLNGLIGKHFRIGELEFTGSCECSPCYWMDEACGEGTHEFLKGYGGLRARILKGGMLAAGVQNLEILGEMETPEAAHV